MHLSYLSPIFITFIAFLVVVQAISISVQERAVSISKKPSLGGKRRPTQSQITTTCSRFRSACIKAALSGKESGKHAIVYDCYKKKPKNKNYFFGCRIGKKDYTTQALSILSGGSTSTIYTANSTTTKTKTTNTQLTSTTSTFTSTQTNTETDFITDEFSSTTTSTVDETKTLPQTLVQSYTTTKTATIEVPTTIVLTNTVTSTTTYTSVGDFFPVVDYQITTNTVLRRSNKLDDNSFCKAYSNACKRQCGRVSSTPKHQVCHQKSTNRFSLSCVCKNRKVETQHALADIGNDQHIVSVSTIATSSATATITSTLVVPTTVVTTQMTTITSHVPVTSTIISTVTSTGTVTDTTTTSTTATASVTSFAVVPVTSTATATATVSATTVVVLAPTGVVKATYSNGTPPRYISRQDSSNRGLNTLVDDITQAEPVVFVADTNTGLYALQYISGGQFLSLFAISYSFSFGFLISANGRPAGPAGGGETYESYVYSIAPNSITKAGIPIQLTWIQPDNSRFTVYATEDYEAPDRYILVSGSTIQDSDSNPPISLSVVTQS